MTRNKAFQEVLDEFLDDGPEAAPRELLRSVLATVATRRFPRRRVGAWRRFNVFSIPMRATAALAAVVIIAAAGLTLSGVLRLSPTAPGGPTATATLPPPTATAVPSATTVPAPTTLVSGAIEISNDATLASGTTYTMAKFTPTLTFLGQAGWYVRGDDPAELVIWRSAGDIHQGLVEMMRPDQVLEVGGTAAPVPADLVAWLQGRSDLVLGKPETLTVGGFKATRFEGTVRAGALLNVGGAINLACATGSGGCSFDGPANLGVAGDDHFYLVVLDVRGEQILMAMTASTTAWSTAAPEFRAMLTSLKFPAVGG